MLHHWQRCMAGGHRTIGRVTIGGVQHGGGWDAIGVGGQVGRVDQDGTMRGRGVC